MVDFGMLGGPPVPGGGSGVDTGQASKKERPKSRSQRTRQRQRRRTRVSGKGKRKGCAIFFLVSVIVVVLCCCGGMSAVTTMFSGGGASQAVGAFGALLFGQNANCGTVSNASYTNLPGGSSGDPGDTYASLNDAQRRNAATIIAVGKGSNIPERGWVIGLMTAKVETNIRNLASKAVPESLNYPNDGVAAGDHDSVGLFQQRASWGTVAQRMDPATSAKKFYDKLLRTSGWESMPLGDAAWAVQVSAFPDRYARWESLARDIVFNVAGSVSGTSPVGFTDAEVVCGNGTAMDCPPTGLPAEEGLSPDALRVIRCLRQNFPRIPAFGGVGYRPNKSDHPAGNAVDAMVNPNNVNDYVLGQQVADWTVQHAAELGVKYVIWNMRIWQTTTRQWLPYSPADNSDGARHTNHVHVSVYGNSAGNSSGWVFPLRGGYTVTSLFGHCTGVHAGGCHEGVDFGVEEGRPILAANAGTVEFAGWNNGGYGNLVKIRHADGTVTYYAHQSQVLVSTGQSVASGAQIGKVGNTGHSYGAHLHFEVRPGGGKAVDPLEFLQNHGVSVLVTV